MRRFLGFSIQLSRSLSQPNHYYLFFIALLSPQPVRAGNKIKLMVPCRPDKTASAIAEYKSLGQEPPVDNVDGVRSSVNQSMDSIQSTFAGSIPRSDFQPEQGNAETHASEKRMDLTVSFNFILCRQRPSLSTAHLLRYIQDP